MHWGDGMRDWTVGDPGYSANDAAHPRNRPPGADAVAPSAEVVALLVAGVAGMVPLRPQAPARAGRTSGPARAGHQASAAERAAAYRAYQERRAERLGSLPEGYLAAFMASVPPGRVCRWW